LPAQALSLSDETANSPDALQVGEPLTLTLRLSAQGLAAEQLPELSLPDIAGAEVYPDQETSQTRDDGQWLRGERIRKFAIVPTRAGSLQIPEIAVGWWNVASDRGESARLPARTIQVGGTAAVASSPSATASDTGAALDPNMDVGSPTPAWRAWLWPALTLLFAVLWIAALRRRGARDTLAATPAPDSSPVRHDWARACKAALSAGDLATVAQALIQQLRQARGDAHHLGDVVSQLEDPTQRAVVERLEQALYRGQDDPQLLPALRTAFAKRPRWRNPVASSQPNPDELPPLYPAPRRQD
jgi:hypothetical protein